MARSHGGCCINQARGRNGIDGHIDRRCCINLARAGDVYAQRSRGQPPIKSDARVTA
ncbi:MAG: hypothetical protein V3Q69_09160 [Burkholderia sp.]